MICLPKIIVDKFVQKLQSGELNPDILRIKDSETRRNIFGEFMSPEEAKSVNALFESKMTLKNWQQCVITWIKETAGLKPEIQRDMLAKVNKMTEILQPKDMDAFLNDLVDKKLGIGVTLEEANKIAELAKTVSEQKAKDPHSLEYGRAKVAFSNYVNDLKAEAKQLTAKEYLKKPGQAASDIAGVAKASKAALDNSSIFRQGWKVMMTHPKTWAKNAMQSFKNIVDTFGGKEVMDEVNAYIVSHPMYDLAKKAGLDVATIEEAYPSSFLQKIPIIGKAFKASEVAFTAFVHKTRMDVFEYEINVARLSGIDIASKVELQAIGKMVNSLTGRGGLGRFESAAGAVNNVLFSPRLLKSNIDFLTAHQFQKDVTPFVRKRAAINLVKVISGSAAILAISNAVNPGSVETDPRSSDFGKIKIGATRFDVSGGMSSILTLASRLITMSSKSSSTGKITDLNSGEFEAQTGADVVYNFFENKLSPASSIVKDLLKGQDYNGNKVTLINEIGNLFMPIPITTFVELQNNPKSANILIAMLADELGISVNTYSITTNWANSGSLELKQFKQKIGDQKFTEANKLFNQQFSDWFSGIITNPKYGALDADQQQSVITKKKNELKDKIFRQYKFHYKSAPKKALPKL